MQAAHRGKPCNTYVSDEQNNYGSNYNKLILFFFPQRLAVHKYCLKNRSARFCSLLMCCDRTALQLAMSATPDMRTKEIISLRTAEGDLFEYPL